MLSVKHQDKTIVQLSYRHFGPKTLDLDLGHFGTSSVGPNCPDRLALVPKCPKDSSHLSAELSCPKCRTVPSQVPKCLGPFLTTTVCSMLKNTVCTL